MGIIVKRYTHLRAEDVSGEIGVSVQARGRYPLPKLISPNRKASTSEALYRNGTRFHFEL